MSESRPICDCGKKAHCIDSRLSDFGRRRRYKCDCGLMFSTMEVRVETHQGVRNSARDGLLEFCDDQREKRAEAMLETIKEIIAGFEIKR